jgi:hypothetical protein
MATKIGITGMRYTLIEVLLPKKRGAFSVMGIKRFWKTMTALSPLQLYHRDDTLKGQ